MQLWDLLDDHFLRFFQGTRSKNPLNIHSPVTLQPSDQTGNPFLRV